MRSRWMCHCVMVALVLISAVTVGRAASKSSLRYTVTVDAWDMLPLLGSNGTPVAALWACL
jgi:hypothetical protein